MRQLKREVKIGNVTIGGKNPIAVQTMLNVPVEDIEGNVAQAKRCEAAGCQILRVTCPSAADAKCIEAVKNAVNIPIVADIHFDYKAAIACADVGVDKIRINPGNIGDDDRVKAVVDACQQKNIPIRIGVNGGSLEKHILAKYGAPVPEAMVAADMEKAAQTISEKYGCAVLCKGGHQINDADDLLWRSGAGKWFRGRRIDNPNTHGTGCTLSSAIASNLAKGYDLDTSVERAKAYISGALAAMLDLGHGSGPMDHMFALKGEFTE